MRVSTDLLAGTAKNRWSEGSHCIDPTVDGSMDNVQKYSEKAMMSSLREVLLSGL